MRPAMRKVFLCHNVFMGLGYLNWSSMTSIALRSKAIVFGFKHRISEVFTSGDVSLHNIVIFLSYKPFETCEILLWITKDDIRFYSEISNVYMWRWGWYFQIVFNKYQHWTFPKHNYESLLHSVWRYLITRSGKWSLKKYSSVSFLCDLCHNIYHKVVSRSDIFSPDYMWNSKVKIWVWARLVKWADLSVSTSQWSSHVSQCLRNNRGQQREAYISQFHSPNTFAHAQDSARCHAETSVVITLDTPISGCITKIVADMHQAITDHQADLNMVMMVPQICYKH